MDGGMGGWTDGKKGERQVGVIVRTTAIGLVEELYVLFIVIPFCVIFSIEQEPVISPIPSIVTCFIDMLYLSGVTILIGQNGREYDCPYTHGAIILNS